MPEDKLPEDEIWDAVVLKKAPPPNLSTVVVMNGAFGFLHFVSVVDLHYKKGDLIYSLMLVCTLFRLVESGQGNQLLV